MKCSVDLKDNASGVQRLAGGPGVSVTLAECPARITDWTNHLPVGWSVLPLKAAARLSFSNVDKKTYEDGTPVRLCNYTDVYYNDFITSALEFMPATATPSEVRRFALRKGDVIITKDSESWDDIAVPACVAEDIEGLVCGYHLALLRPKPEFVDGRYLFRALQAEGVRDQFHVAATGVTRFGLGQGAVGAALVPIPPLPVQRGIADFLDRKTAALDGLIARKERLLELLAERRAALIHRAVTRGLDPDVPLKDSGVPWIGEIPAHWEVKRLKHVLQERPDSIRVGPFGSSLRLSEMQDSHTRVFTQRTVIDGDFAGGEAFVSEEKARELHSFYAGPGDILITTRGTIGRVAIVPVNVTPGIIHPCLMAVRIDPSEVLADWAVMILGLKNLALAQLSYLSNATTIEVIYSYNLREILVPVPPMHEQREVLATIQHLDSSSSATVAHLKTQLSLLREYRQALITAAVTGQLEIPEVPA